MKNSMQDWTDLIPNYLNKQLSNESLMAFEEAMNNNPKLKDAVEEAQDVRFVLEHQQAYRDMDLIRSLRAPDDDTPDASSRPRRSFRYWMLIPIAFCMFIAFLLQAYFKQHVPLLQAPYPVDQLGFFQGSEIESSVELYKKQAYQESLSGFIVYHRKEELPEAQFLLLTNYYYLGQLDDALNLLPDNEPYVLSEQFDFYGTLIALEKGDVPLEALKEFSNSQDDFIREQSSLLAAVVQ